MQSPEEADNHGRAQYLFASLDVLGWSLLVGPLCKAMTWMEMQLAVRDGMSSVD